MYCVLVRAYVCEYVCVFVRTCVCACVRTCVCLVVELHLVLLMCVCAGYLVFDRIRRKSQYVPPGSIKPVMLPGTVFLFNAQQTGLV